MLFFELFPAFMAVVALLVGIGLFVMDRQAVRETESGVRDTGIRRLDDKAVVCLVSAPKLPDPGSRIPTSRPRRVALPRTPV
jgi:hypothetical protein